jgi:hypothetical protein
MATCLREAAPAKAGNAAGMSAVALAKAGGFFQHFLNTLTSFWSVLGRGINRCGGKVSQSQENQPRLAQAKKGIKSTPPTLQDRPPHLRQVGLIK